MQHQHRLAGIRLVDAAQMQALTWRNSQEMGALLWWMTIRGHGIETSV
jgi:hypothetical protein